MSKTGNGNYNTEYTTKHSTVCFDVDINGSGKVCLSFNFSLVYQFSWPNGNGSGFAKQGS